MVLENSQRTHANVAMQNHQYVAQMVPAHKMVAEFSPCTAQCKRQFKLSVRRIWRQLSSMRVNRENILVCEQPPARMNLSSCATSTMYLLLLSVTQIQKSFAADTGAALQNCGICQGRLENWDAGPALPKQCCKKVCQMLSGR